MLKNECYLEKQQGESGNAAQRWQLSPIAEDYYLIVNVRNKLVLDYRNEDSGVYLETQQGPKGGPAQQWRIVKVGNDLAYIENNRLTESNGLSMVLDYREGQAAYLESKRGEQGNPAQQWRLKPVEDDTYLIENRRSSTEAQTAMVLDYRNRAEEESAGNFPKTAEQHTELGSHHRMRSTALLSKNGRLDVSTRTLTANKWEGFTGKVVVVLYDQDGNHLWNNQGQRYGVNATGPFENERSRDDHFSENVAREILTKTTTVAICHERRQMSFQEMVERLVDNNRKATKAAKEIMKEWKKVSGEANHDQDQEPADQ